MRTLSLGVELSARKMVTAATLKPKILALGFRVVWGLALDRKL